MYHKHTYIHSFIICWVITMHCYSKLAANEYKLYHKSLANITLCSSSNTSRSSIYLDETDAILLDNI